MPEIGYMKDGDGEAGSFEAVGHAYEVDYGGDLLVRFEFHSVRSMTILGLKGEHKGFKETVEISVTQIRPRVFMVAWQEANRTAVAHIEDFENGVIYANIVMPDNAFVRLQGRVDRVC